MSVYKKLQQARAKLNQTKLTKSGKNSFAKFNYFELADFMPAVTNIFNDVGLCGIVSFTNDTAYLTIYDVDGDERAFVTFTSPLVMASMDRIQPIQSLGGTHTYYRRYLYLMACDLVESDLVDSVEPQEKPREVKAEPKVETKPVKLEGKSGEWQLKVSTEGDWGQSVKQATNVLLAIAEKPADVDNVFKVNRVIYDELKEKHKTVYDEILSVFKITKEELK
jgi:ERF superfamily